MKLRRRIAFHFSLQFIVLLIALFFITVLLFLFIANFMTKEELRANIKRGIIENVPISTVISDDNEVEIAEKWHHLIKENKMWLQLVNPDGEVIYAINSPQSLQKAYSTSDLLLIEGTKKINQYEVESHYEVWGNNGYYFLFGHRSNQEHLLNEWYVKYSEQGTVNKEKKPLLEQELSKNKGFIEIYQDGKKIQTIGENSSEQYTKLDLISRIHEPDKHATKAFIYNDEHEDVSWVFHQVNKEYKENEDWLLPSKETQIFLIAIIISLSFAIALSIWNGYRYGKPLIMFVNWLDRMEKKPYVEVLSDKERKKIFKKKGKVKHRYRLYQEVIASFSKMSKKLAAAEEERKQLERTREEWMAGISHDLRTPLSSIQGYGHLLESNKYTFTEKELTEIGNVIREKSDYMVQLLDDFSLVFQLKNSVITIEKTTVDLNNFVKKNVLKFKNDLTITTNEFIFKPATEPCFVAIDPKWFVRVLDNLLSNAIKHNPPNTLIEVEVMKDVEQAMIQIKDNGKGMDEQFVNNLFDRYYRGTSTSEQTDGEGLGMSITKAIIDLHDGIIDVKSKVGEGTTVTIIIKK